MKVLTDYHKTKVIKMSNSSNLGINPKKVILLGILGVAALFLVIVAAGAIVQVDPGYEGVVYDNSVGILDTPLKPGIHLRTPFWQTVTQIEVRTQKNEVSAAASSKDMQDVSTVIAVNYHPTEGLTPILYQKIGLDYGPRVIAPVIQESVKAVIAQYTAEELITKRALVSQEISNTVTNKLANKYITIEAVSIVNFAFSPEFTKSIEDKQIAEQQALKAKNDLARIEVEAQQKIATAEAEAKAIEIKGNALKSNPELVALEWVTKWDGHMPTYYMGNGDASVLVGIPAV